MTQFLRQATASQSRTLGPFVDDADGKTAETGLTIANTDIKLMANGGSSANKNSGGGTHRVNGMYGVTFDATDTATVGELEVSVVVAGALPVFATFTVLEEAVYDALFAASAPGYVANAPVSVAQFGGTNGTFSGGRPEVNTTHINGVSTSSVTTVSSHIGTTGASTAQTGDSYAVVADSTYGLSASYTQLLLRCPWRFHFVAASGGNNANAGTYSAPLATIAQAITNAVNGDYIVLLNGEHTTSGISTTKRLNLIGIKSGPAGLGEAILTTSSGAGTINYLGDGSTVRHLSISNTTNNSNAAAIQFDGGDGTPGNNVTFEDCVVATSIGQYGARFLGKKGIRLINTSFTGVARGIAVLSSHVHSEGGRYEGQESGVYLDATDSHASFVGRGNNEIVAYNATSTSKAVSIFTCLAPIFFECHDATKLVTVDIDGAPVLRGWATHASFPDRVAAVIGESTSGITRGKVYIRGGSVDVVNSGAGATNHFVANAGSEMRIENVSHDSAQNSGNVQVVNEDVATAATQSTAAAASASSADSKATSIKGVTDKLDTALELNSGSYRYTEAALTQAPAGEGGGAQLSPFLVTPGHSWRFDSPLQVTAPNIIVENTGFDDLLLELDLTGALAASAAISTISNVTVADVAEATEPTVVSSAKRTDGKAIHIKTDGASATAGKYTYSATITTTDGQTLTRKGVLQVK